MLNSLAEKIIDISKGKILINFQSYERIPGRVKVAKFPIILFIDSDCEVDRNIFNEHLKCPSYNHFNGQSGRIMFLGGLAQIFLLGKIY